MDNNKHYQPRRRPQYRNTDGFRSFPLADHPYAVQPNNLSQTSASAGSVSDMPNPHLARHNSSSNEQPKSLLNTTIPGVGSQSYQLRQQSDNAKQTRKKLTKKKVIKRSILAILVLLIGAGGFLGIKDLNVIDKVLHGNLFSDVQSLFTSTKLNGESTGRVNILLAGYQGASSDEGALTDSIMVVSIDTKNNTAFTLSIPRDLWVDVPGDGHEKINAANTNTNFSQPGNFRGGMGQLQAIVQQDLGIPINYYALIDYAAFEDAVNAVGGITVNIQSPDPRGLYDPNVDKAHGGPLKLPNGPVNLNGLSALALALARGDSAYSYGFPASDIDRTTHQRQMLIALEKKALTAGVITNPITISQLVSSVGDNVTTNLNLADVLRLAQLAKVIKTSNITSDGLSYGGTNPLLTSYIAPDGEDALAPSAGLDNFSQIQNYYQQLTSNNTVVK
jgi:LCP family protein required for cell wall assembly